MPSGKPHPLDLYPASWLAAARDAVRQPGVLQQLPCSMSGDLPGSRINTQQRKIRAFIAAIPLWPRVAPDLARAAAIGRFRTHQVCEGPCWASIVTFSISFGPRLGDPGELIEKAIAGG